MLSDAPDFDDDDDALIVGLDLARHRLLCAVDANGVRAIEPLADGHDGLVMRWIHPDGSMERLPDRIVSLAGVDQDTAVETARLIAQTVFGEADHIPGDIRLAVPASLGPLGAQAILDGFLLAGIHLTPASLTPRPIAAFASWLYHRRLLGLGSPRGPFVVLDVDAGAVSAAVIDTDAHCIIDCQPLSRGPEDPIDAVADRLRQVLGHFGARQSGQTLIRNPDADRVAALIPQVLVTGRGSGHSRCTELIRRVLPAAAIVSDPVVPAADQTVAFGLLSLDTLRGWRIGYPTVDLCLGHDPIRFAGPIRPDTTAVTTLGPDVDAAAVESQDPDATEATAIPLAREIDDALHEDLPIQPHAGAVLRLVDHNRRPHSLRVGPKRGEAIVLPHDLGPSPRLRLLSDGRLLILGPLGTRPWSAVVHWPPPRSTAPITLTPIGPRPIELLREENSTSGVRSQPCNGATAAVPTVDPPHRATAESLV